MTIEMTEYQRIGMKYYMPYKTMVDNVSLKAKGTYFYSITLPDGKVICKKRKNVRIVEFDDNE